MRRTSHRTSPIPAERWLPLRIAVPDDRGGPLVVGALHVPNRVSGLKEEFHASVLDYIRRWRSGPALIVGDTNSGRPGIDDRGDVFDRREDNWMVAVEKAGWIDAFRHIHGNAREYTWYSPNAGNGFRLDQAFVHRSAISRVRSARHEWGLDPRAPWRRDALSDHAALIVELG